MYVWFFRFYRSDESEPEVSDDEIDSDVEGLGL